MQGLKMRKLPAISAIFLFAACSAKLIAPTQSDVERGKSKFPDVTLTELTTGKKLMEQNCGKCHGLIPAGARTEEQWRRIMPKMAKKAKIDANSEMLITKYVITLSAAPK
jgi:cytochrome c